jgi:3-oxoacyl-[acyl-carrier-protein] synthase-3
VTTTPAGERPLITPAVGSPHARILSVGAYRPARVVTNDEICERIDSSDQWIRERSGIVTRRFAAADETVVDLAEAAARQAIERAGLAAADVDAVLVATMSHPYQTPAAATLLAIVDPTDRSTAFLFGDGAGAVLVGGSRTPGIGPTVWGSDGGQWDAIRQDRSWLEAGTPGPDGSTTSPHLTMVGQTVFRWAVWQMAPAAQKALDAAGITTEELAAFVPHQANQRIIDAMAKQLRLPAHVAIARDVVDTGNTSAASIPLAMDRMLAEGTAPHGGLALLIGFGAGLAYAAQVVELP